MVYRPRDPNSFGFRLRSVRRQRGLTQSQWGDIFGVSRVTVGRWETDDFVPSRRMMNVLARLLEPAEFASLPQEHRAHSTRWRSLGTVIRKMRRRHQLTQQQWADALGVNVKTVNRWEQDLTTPRDAELARMMDWADDDEELFYLVWAKDLAG